jgi:tryprostatin B 6-hydroxylase
MDLVIRSAAAVQLIHGSNSQCTKRGLGTFEIFDWDDGFSLETIMDRDSHRERRRIWDRAQNPHAMAHYETCTRKAVRTWLGKVTSLKGEAIEMSKAMLLLAFDNMGQIGFSKEFGATQKGEGARWIHLMGALFEQIASLGGLSWPTLIAASLEKLGRFGPLKNALEFDISPRTLRMIGLT